MKVLQILEGAYRATLEEQDDPALWITQAMRGAGGEFNVLLRGNAVNYACAAQDARGLRLGDWSQSQPPDIGADLTRLLSSGVGVCAVFEDVQQRGIAADLLRPDIEMIRRDALPGYLQRFDQIWHW
ncbi:MAG TPA: hypothetical protein VKB34_00140 [Povalibacter sp.]|nr:hypothetical protein [Povalibacter sp.]